VMKEGKIVKNTAKP